MMTAHRQCIQKLELLAEIKPLALTDNEADPAHGVSSTNTEAKRLFKLNY